MLSRAHFEVIKFVISGVANTGISLVAYWVLDLFMPYRWAYSIAYVFGIGISYILQAKWVFRGKWSLRHIAFPLVYLVQYALSISLLSLLIELLGVQKFWAPLLVVVATLPVTFLLSRYVIGRTGEAEIETLEQPSSVERELGKN